MKKIIPGCALIVSLALCACAKGGANVAATETRKTTVYFINGMSPDDYYRQFLFKLTRACGRGAVIYRFAASETVKIAVNARGRDVLANLSVFMSADHTFQAFYQEMDVLNYTTDGFTYRDSRETVVRGQWRINEDRLVFDTLGVARPMYENGRPKMVLRMKDDLMTKGLKGAALILANVRADYMPIPALDPCR